MPCASTVALLPVGHMALQGTPGARARRRWDAGRAGVQRKPGKCCGEEPILKSGSLQGGKTLTSASQVWSPYRSLLFVSSPFPSAESSKKGELFLPLPLRQFKSIIPLPFKGSVVEALALNTDICASFNPLCCLRSKIPPSAPRRQL